MRKKRLTRSFWQSSDNFAKSWFSGRGWGPQLFSFQSPVVHWLVRTASLNCLFSCRSPYQTPHALNCLPPFHWKTLFFTGKCFVASPSPKSTQIWRVLTFFGPTKSDLDPQNNRWDNLWIHCRLGVILTAVKRPNTNLKVSELLVCIDIPSRPFRLAIPVSSPWRIQYCPTPKSRKMTQNLQFGVKVHNPLEPPQNPENFKVARSKVTKKWQGPRKSLFSHFDCDPSRHLQESPDPPGPKSQKVSRKGLFGGLQKSPQKYPKKSKNTDFRTFLGIFRLFWVFFGTFLQTPERPFLRLFCDFGPRGPEDSCKWRLGSQHFELLWIFRGFGTSRGHALSQT